MQNALLHVVLLPMQRNPVVMAPVPHPRQLRPQHQQQRQFQAAVRQRADPAVLVPPDQPDRLDHRERMETTEMMDSPDRRERPEAMASH